MKRAPGEEQKNAPAYNPAYDSACYPDYYADFLPRTSLSDILYVNGHVLSKIFKPYLKMLCMRLIVFYQKRISRHTCLYRPTCSQYTLESINNRGVISGIFLGAWRILRCNPFSKGGYDPPKESRYLKWVL